MKLNDLYAVSTVCAVLCTLVRAEQVSLQADGPHGHGAERPPTGGAPRAFDGRKHELALLCTNEYNHCSTSCTGARTRTIMQLCVDYCQSRHCTATCAECGVEVPGWTLQQMLESPSTVFTVSPSEQPSDRGHGGCLRRCIGTERPDEQLSLVNVMHDDISRILSWDVLSSVVTVYGCQLYCTISSVL